MDIFITLAGALVIAAVWVGWQMYARWRERKDEEALDHFLEHPERFNAEPSSPEKEAAELAALRQRLKQEREGNRE